jgi:hypothetical protein
LGVLICWQLVFLLGINSLRAIMDLGENPIPGPTLTCAEHLSLDLPAEKGPLRDVFKILDRWAEMTGQYQNWCLFAPDVAKHITFLEVEFSWGNEGAGSRPDREPVSLLSENEPANTESYFRWSLFRLRKYEGHLDLVLRVWDDESRADTERRWRNSIEEKVRKEWDSMMAYCQWRWRQYEREHPDCPTPTQMTLFVRRYAIPLPDREPWTWDGPYREPVARWQPGAPASSKYLPVEAYNPVARRFEKLEW